MGLINFGIPRKEAIFLKLTMGLDVFVETGTYYGQTAKEMSSEFRKVYTIEKSEIMFKKASQNLKDISNITIINGDSREYLKDIIESNDNILFFLDAHWSGGDTYGKKDECPIIEELKIIFNYPKNYVILIDDARLFLAPPPRPHNYKNWPSIKDIFNVIPKTYNNIVYEDVLYLYPITVEEKFKDYLQRDVTEKWNKNNSIFLEKVIRRLNILKYKIFK